MKILVLGGMHGNEPFGQLLVESLATRPIAGVTTLLANPPACSQNQRFIDQDLNRSFPGRKRSPLYEPKRAHEILARTKDFDIVLDFHNTLANNNDCCFIGPNYRNDLVNIATFLNLNRVVIAEYNCINKYAKNCLSIELSTTSPLNNLQMWRKFLTRLVSNPVIPANPRALALYRYIGALTPSDAQNLQLSYVRATAFEALPVAIAQHLGYQQEVYWIFPKQNYDKTVYAGLIEKV